MTATTSHSATLNEETLHDMLGTMVSELGAAVIGAHVTIGDELGLYKELAAADGLTAAALANRTDTAERYVREWLSAQAASGYIEYDAEKDTFHMTPEQTAILADTDSPYYMAGAFYGLGAVYASQPKLTDAFRTGDGVGWGDHKSCLYCGTEKFFRPSYRSYLSSEWLPALDGVVDKLKAGGTVADVGCGHGVSTIVMAEEYPASEFYGYDFHPPSIERARELAAEADVDNVTFEVAAAKTYSGDDYDLVTCFDCLHDMGDPVGAAAHVRETLADDGTWMIVEPMAGDTLEENLNPVGRVYYGLSTAICVPASMDQEVGAALGAQAGQDRLGDVVRSGGFTRFRRATETPFNMILEARP